MFRKLIAVFCLACLAGIGSAVAYQTPARITELSQPDEIADANYLVESIIGGAVGECMHRERAPLEECFCRDQEVAERRHRIEQVLARHPNWRGQTLMWIRGKRNLTSSRSTTIVLGHLLPELEKHCPAPAAGERK